MEEKRILYYVKILAHTPEELGSLANALAEKTKMDLKTYDEMAYRFWEKVRQALKNQGLNQPEVCKKLHIYADGLPVAEEPHFQRVVEALIKLEIPLYLLAKKLIERGAKIHGTESRELLQEEHNMWHKVAQGVEPDPQRKENLLKERDEFIANIINQTLPPKEIGILFIGAVHDVVVELNKLEEADQLTSPLKIIYL